MDDFHIIAIPWDDGIIESFYQKIVLEMHSCGDGYIRPSLNAWHTVLGRSGTKGSLHDGRRKSLSKVQVQPRLRWGSFVSIIV